MSDSRMAFFHRLLVSWGFISFSSSCITRSHRFSSRNGRREGRKRKGKRWNTKRNRLVSLFHRVLSYYTSAFDQRSRGKYSGKQLKHSIHYKVFSNFWIYSNGEIVFLFLPSLDLFPRFFFFIFTQLHIGNVCTLTDCFISSLIITKLSLRKLSFNPWTSNVKGHIPLCCDFWTAKWNICLFISESSCKNAIH